MIEEAMRRLRPLAGTWKGTGAGGGDRRGRTGR